MRSIGTRIRLALLFCLIGATACSRNDIKLTASIYTGPEPPAPEMQNTLTETQGRIIEGALKQFVDDFRPFATSLEKILRDDNGGSDGQTNQKSRPKEISSGNPNYLLHKENRELLGKIKFGLLSESIEQNGETVYLKAFEGLGSFLESYGSEWEELDEAIELGLELTAQFDSFEQNLNNYNPDTSGKARYNQIAYLDQQASIVKTLIVETTEAFLRVAERIPEVEIQSVDATEIQEISEKMTQLIQGVFGKGGLELGQTIELNKSRLAPGDQLEQKLSDPRWKHIHTQSRRSMWKNFEELKIRTDGTTSIVIAQNGAHSFILKSVVNDPTEIYDAYRSIATRTIEMAGSVALASQGIPAPIPKIVRTDENGKTTTSRVAQTQLKTEQESVRQRQIDARQKRNDSERTYRNVLGRLRDAVTAIEANDKDTANAYLAHAKALLKDAESKPEKGSGEGEEATEPAPEAGDKDVNAEENGDAGEGRAKERETGDEAKDAEAPETAESESAEPGEEILSISDEGTTTTLGSNGPQPVVILNGEPSTAENAND